MADLSFEEVKLTMPSGQIIAGKWYGNKSIRPILCLHGREDNAGTFDRLIPMLSDNFSYLAIDFPGHGRSSWIPNGRQYKIFDYLFVVDFLFKYYKWDKLSILAHSMGARVGFTYASLYPKRVDLLISIDVLNPAVLGTKSIKRLLNEGFERSLKNDMMNQESTEPPSYTFDEMIEKIHKGTMKSVTRETAHHLLERNIQPSKKYPGKFYFSRDRRIQSTFQIYIPLETQLGLAENLKMPFLYLKVTNSSYAKPQRDKNEAEAIKVLEKHPHFKYCVIESDSHHVHLTEPEKIYVIINEFLGKHRRVKSQL
ncbi:probable serine hydrolase [Chironomus tepperi]|uniref:probable serine hydrolase n=1 Tax=Chironomus tepperi TaxID=113505 RepID=UPI00391F3490